MNRRRYYFHGDTHETDAAEYFCARCDVFAEAPHFDTGGCLLERAGRDVAAMREHGSKVLASLRELGARGQSRFAYWRPANAPTVWDRG